VFQEVFMKSPAKAKIKYLILILAAAACLYGALSGELEAVFQKAAAICLECIGIG